MPCKAPRKAQKRAAIRSAEAADFVLADGCFGHPNIAGFGCSHSHYVIHSYAAADNVLNTMAQACIAACPLAPQVDQMIAQEEATSTPGETANLQAGQTAANANPNLAG